MSRRVSQQKIIGSLVATLVTVLLLIAQSHGWLKPIADTATSSQPGLYTVTRFVDGDTIVVNMNGKDQKIRFIGVDTPETHKPNTPVQCYGPAAAAYTKQVLTNQKFRLVSDSLSTNYDRYGRLLRYVVLTDGTNINLQIIKNGYGFYYPYFPFEKSVAFAEAQRSAQTQHKGIWANCSPTQTDKGGWVSPSI